MYVCKYIRTQSIYIHTHIHAKTNIYAYGTYRYVFLYKCVCIDVCGHLCMYGCKYVRLNICM